MKHSLKKLYEYLSKYYPEITDKFEYLEEYCTRATTLNKGYRTLYWMVMAMRETVPSKQLEKIFFNIVCEAAIRGEEHLYDNIFHYRNAVWNDKYIKAGIVDVNDLPAELLDGYEIVLNNTGRNFVGLTFKNRPSTAILIQSFEDTNTLALYVNKTSPINRNIHLWNALYDHLRTDKAEENWEILQEPGNNLKISSYCTNMQASELYMILKNFYEEHGSREEEGEEEEADMF